MTFRMNRRKFVSSSLGLAAAMTVPPGILLAKEKNQKLKLGIIGVSNRGAANLAGVTGEEIVALCDIDEKLAAKARAAHPQAKYFKDFRRLIDMKEIDAVVISTPDHVHAVQALAAMRSGKHVYCEKPLTHSVLEVREVVRTAKEKGLVTQMGTQIHAEANYRRVVEIIQAGTLGDISRVIVWNSGKPRSLTLAKTPTAIPEGVDYNSWLGPVPHLDYDPARFHFLWRWFYQLGGGVLADLGCHYMDLPHWALNLRKPISVSGMGKKMMPGDQDAHDLMQVDYRYPARGSLPPVHLTWFHGVRGPGFDHDKPYHGFSSAILFEGSKASLIADYSRYKMLPEDKFVGFQPPPKSIPDSIGHHKEWLEAIRTKGPTTCNFEYSGALAETVLLGNVAARSGVKFDWNDAKATTGHADADKYLFRPYRQGWSLYG